MTGPSERLTWAVEALDVRPHQRLLEIGCGHGVAVSLVCDKLESGRITALDRSAKMIAAARSRNVRHIEAGRAAFHAVALRDAELGDAQFDTVFAIRVGLFAGSGAAPDLAVVAERLAPEGRFFVIYDPADAQSADGAADRIVANLTNAGFVIHSRLVAEVGSTRTVRVVASVPNRRYTKLQMDKEVNRYV